MAAESFCYPVTEGESLSVRAELPQAVAEPVQKGQKLGIILVISCGERTVGTIDLVSKAQRCRHREARKKTEKKKTLAETLWQFLSAG